MRHGPGRRAGGAGAHCCSSAGVGGSCRVLCSQRNHSGATRLGSYFTRAGKATIRFSTGSPYAFLSCHLRRGCRSAQRQFFFGAVTAFLHHL